jgi:hypothetical protein
MKNIAILIFMIILFLSFSSEAKETRTPVVIIDSGVSYAQSKKPYMCKNGVLSTTADNGIDEHGHGTNITSIVSSKINKKYCIVSIKVYKNNVAGISSYIAGLRLAVNIHPAIINISMDGDAGDFFETLYIQRALMYGAKVVVAAGNNSVNLDLNCRAFPTCVKKEISSLYSKNMFIVGATDTGSSNYGMIVTHRLSGKGLGFPKMSGTSQAAASLTSRLVQK